jgi:hypothetical protein
MYRSIIKPIAITDSISNGIITIPPLVSNPKIDMLSCGVAGILPTVDESEIIDETCRIKLSMFIKKYF